MTRQEMFDTAVRGVIKQGRASATFSPNNTLVGCLYRLFDQDHKVLAKCAVGHLIPDHIYDAEIDDCFGSDIAGLLEFLKDERGFAISDEPTADIELFLLDLQDCHDDAARSGGPAGFVEAFKTKAYGFAIMNGLNLSALTETPT